MRRYLYLVLALLLVVGVANAQNIPRAIDPRNGPSVATVPVYNSGPDALPVGAVAVWNISNSAATDDNWVISNTTANTGIVAGIVYPVAIPARSDGQIAVRGVVTALADSVGIYANAALCTSATQGRVTGCASANDARSVGFAVATGTTADVKIYVDTL